MLPCFVCVDVGGSSTGLLDVSTARLYQVIHATLGDNVTVFCVFDVGGASTGLIDFSTARLSSDTRYTGDNVTMFCVFDVGGASTGL